MAEGPTGSTVPRRQLGRNLKELRNRARLTVRAAAKKLEWSEAKMWRIETGQTPLRSLDVQAMCQVYGAPPDLTEALMGLAKETKARGWWHAYGDSIPEGFDVYVGLEEAAESVSVYGSDLVPGLLQTDGYAREIIRTHIRGIGDADLDGRVRLRIERQALLTRVTDPLAVRVVLGEAVLRRSVGGPEVMARQLAHLVYVAGLPNISLRVVPFAAGMHLGVVTGPFVILRFPLTGDGVATEPPTVYADGYTGGLYLDKEGEVKQYDTAFDGIWEASLDEQASRHLISEVAGSYGQG
ncbi:MULTISPECIES: helix-turn-helix domain-containing protein [unclassified Streptomyces]|uniref:helix-turn-helix domain-containing protein n=1 Tax=unclassified Streptomyces TaxID=2593676 RepID=UPI0016600E80|nr:MULTISPECIES: helix-turn-helix transcriptional regulator [unclassified Streptomyces]MBD0707248.1 transcriptional regulator [Streptomyces sp. CBMA291]MBD0713736.1 transcriptional regulator [Streptomyces sp. CBMA370]